MGQRWEAGEAETEGGGRRQVLLRARKRQREPANACTHLRSRLLPLLQVCFKAIVERILSQRLPVPCTQVPGPQPVDVGRRQQAAAAVAAAVRLSLAVLPIFRGAENAMRCFLGGGQAPTSHQS